MEAQLLVEKLWLLRRVVLIPMKMTLQFALLQIPVRTTFNSPSLLAHHMNRFSFGVHSCPSRSALVFLASYVHEGLVYTGAIRPGGGGTYKTLFLNHQRLSWAIKQCSIIEAGGTVQIFMRVTNIHYGRCSRSSRYDDAVRISPSLLLQFLCLALS